MSLSKKEPFEILDELPASATEDEPSILMELETQEIETIDYRRIESDFVYESTASAAVSSLHDDNSTAAVLVGTQKSTEIDKLCETIKDPEMIEIYSFKEFLTQADPEVEAIEEKDGVFKIKESVYNARQGERSNKKKDFKELVDSVLKGDSEHDSIESIFDFGPIDLGLNTVW